MKRMKRKPAKNLEEVIQRLSDLEEQRELMTSIFCEVLVKMDSVLKLEISHIGRAAIEYLKKDGELFQNLEAQQNGDKE